MPTAVLSPNMPQPCQVCAVTGIVLTGPRGVDRRLIDLLKAGFAQLELDFLSKVMISCKNGVCYRFNGMPR